MHAIPELWNALRELTQLQLPSICDARITAGSDLESVLRVLLSFLSLVTVDVSENMALGSSTGIAAVCNLMQSVASLRVVEVIRKNWRASLQESFDSRVLEVELCAESLRAEDPLRFSEVILQCQKYKDRVKAEKKEGQYGHRG